MSERKFDPGPAGRKTAQPTKVIYERRQILTALVRSTLTPEQMAELFERFCQTHNIRLEGSGVIFGGIQSHGDVPLQMLLGDAGEAAFEAAEKER